MRWHAYQKRPKRERRERGKCPYSNGELGNLALLLIGVVCRAHGMYGPGGKKLLKINR